MSNASNERQFDRTGAQTMVERRGNVRRATHAIFTGRFEPAQVMGGGRDVSRSGAYFITSDEVRLEVCFDSNGREVRAPAKIIRVEQVSPGTYGIAVQFERRLHDHELP
ncbi:MAG: PilZ domain-containing protein [Planctomycetes bacterium]|nr:PilZ domain-containing protein [Planctomycetota bacterium]